MAMCKDCKNAVYSVVEKGDDYEKRVFEGCSLGLHKQIHDYCEKQEFDIETHHGIVRFHEPPKDDTEAEWTTIDMEDGEYIKGCVCSKCRIDPMNDYIEAYDDWWMIRLPNYCPNCGRKMLQPERLKKFFSTELNDPWTKSNQSIATLLHNREFGEQDG